MIIDIVVGAVVLISAIISFLRGLIRETLTIAGVIGGFFAAVYFGPKLAPTFSSWIGVAEDQEEIRKLFDIVPMNIVADICAYASVFIIVVIIISLISHFTAGAAKAMGLGPIDRTLGVIFGIARAIVLLGLLYMPFHLLMDTDSKTKYFGESKTHTIIEGTAQFMTRFLPSSGEVEATVKNVTEGEIKKKLFENDILFNKKEKAVEPTPEPETGYDRSERLELNDLIREEPSYNQ
jgi:membrane protein required for colicin V production